MNPRYIFDCKAPSAEWRVADDFWVDREKCDVTGSDVAVRVERVGGSAIGGTVELDVEIKGTATMPCDRCLDDCALPVEWRETVEMECADGEVDLEQYIYESIILGLPFSKMHARREDCNPEMIKKIITEQ